ncbi:MAG: hypothetical protein ABI413_02205 [Ktedonobacteraceae bacterium]
MSKEQPERDYYNPNEIRKLLDQVQKSTSTFYTLVRENKIQKYLHPQIGSPVYAKADVDAFLAGHLTKVGTARRKKTQESSTQVQAGSKDKKNLIFRPLTLDDIGKAYQLQYDEFKRIGGVSYAAQPTSMEIWVKEGRDIFWVAQDSRSNRILATIGIIPLDEELIIRFLREEFSLLEMTITDVLSYKAGVSHAAYMIAAADHERPDAANALVQLMEHLLAYWSEQYPDISVRMLYTLASLRDMNESPIMPLLRTFFFSRRRDLSPDLNKAVWELPLDEPNPAFVIQKFQKSMKEKRMVVTEFRIEESAKLGQVKADHPFKAPLEYRPAKTKADVAAMVQIGAEIFLPPGAKPAISNEEQVEAWYSWLEKNPEIFHVIIGDDEIIGYISLIPLPQSVIDEIMKGVHPVRAIKAEDVLLFEPSQALDTYTHIWGTTPRLSDSQKRFANSKILKEMVRMFEAFGRRGIDVRTIYTRSNKADGINISEHLGMEDLVVPGVTDLPELDKKRVFRLDTSKSSNPFIIHYRQALKAYEHAHTTESNVK